MTDKEILSNAIDKAIASGYVLLPMQGSIDHLDIPLYAYHFYGIIFSHSFAQHFWSNEKVCLLDGSKLKGERKFTECILNQHFGWHTEFLPEWEYHLMMMVREENPIKYLEEWL